MSSLEKLKPKELYKFPKILYEEVLFRSDCVSAFFLHAVNSDPLLNIKLLINPN